MNSILQGRKEDIYNSSRDRHKRCPIVQFAVGMIVRYQTWFNCVITGWTYPSYARMNPKKFQPWYNITMNELHLLERVPQGKNNIKISRLKITLHIINDRHILSSVYLTYRSTSFIGRK